MSFWCPGGTSLAHAYPKATRYLGKARARLHRLLNDVAFVRLAEPPPTAVACFSLHNVKSRPATVGDKLTTRNFNTGTCGFATPEDSTTAVCILPGTELAFSAEVICASSRLFGWRTISSRTAIFRQIDKDVPQVHHDALEFPDGTLVLLTDLHEGQQATVLQLPAQPKTPAEATAQTRVLYVG